MSGWCRTFSARHRCERSFSKDKKAWYLPSRRRGESGSPESGAAYLSVADLKHTFAGVRAVRTLTGPASTVADVTRVGAGSDLIEIGMVDYGARDPADRLPESGHHVGAVVTIGISLVTAQAVLAGFAELGLGVSTRTIMVFMSGVLFGAGNGLRGFLISRYHDYAATGREFGSSGGAALASIGKVMATSAATVAVTFLAMIFTQLQVFSTVGLAFAIAIGVAFLAGCTLLPAILVLVGSTWLDQTTTRTSLYVSGDVPAYTLFAAPKRIWSPVWLCSLFWPAAR